MSEFSRGGVIPGVGSVSVTLDPDECVFDRDLRCQRTDKAHNRDQIELRSWASDVIATRWGPCRHRHPEPVESVVTGEVVAYLCPACDAQLPGPNA